MPRQSARAMYERISDYVDLFAEKHYGGEKEGGFRHWAFAELFVEHDLSDNDIIIKTQIDGPYDFGVDGYLVEDSEEEKVIHLLQCKFRNPGSGSSTSKNELLSLVEAPANLLMEKNIAACPNEETKVLHDTLVDLLPQGYALRLVWATSGTLSPDAKLYATEKASHTISTEIRGKVYDTKVSFEAYDLRALVDLYQSHLESDDVSDSVDVIEVDPNMCHDISSKFKTLQLTIPAKQIIELRHKNGYKIYRLNPRGPLGNKTNTQIKQTLLDPAQREMFHMLNNGLSAICESYKLDGSSLMVRNLLVVNGCQTTETLWNVRAAIQDNPNVLVNLKLMECSETFHPLIARTTNTQAPLRAEDFISTNTIQRELQRQFDSLIPPWFYQIKRSEWSRMTPGKRKYLEPDWKSYRWTKSKDVAQALVAFIGYPGEAKDKIRLFFEEKLSSAYGEVSYKEIYSEGISAAQLLLPTILYKAVNEFIKNDKDKPEYDWLEYARFHLLWLIGELLRDYYGVPRAVFSKAMSQTLIDCLDAWAFGLYGIALHSVSALVEDLRESGVYSGHREFFRSAANYQTMLNRIRGSRNLARNMGKDPLANLPKI